MDYTDFTDLKNSDGEFIELIVKCVEFVTFFRF